MKPFIGLKRIWYGAEQSEMLKPNGIKTWISTATEVMNVHQGTWGYTQDDPSVTDYINELTGKPYFRDVDDNGVKTINFTLGEYSFADRVALQGGKMYDSNGAVTTDKSNAVMWESPKNYSVIYKSILAQTKTGNFVFFPRAGVITKVDTQEKNLGLGIQAVAMDQADTALTDEYWYDGADIDIDTVG